MSHQELLAAVSAGDVAAFEAVAKKAKSAPSSRVFYALQSTSPDVRDAILRGVKPEGPFHAGAVAICADDEAALRAAHAAGVSWTASVSASGGIPAVHLAAKLGRARLLKVLVELGVDVTHRAKYDLMEQGTPFAFAVNARQWEAVEALLAVPAVDPNSADCVWTYADLKPAQLKVLVERGLDPKFIAAHFAMAASALTPAGLRRLLDIGFAITPEVVAGFFFLRSGQAPESETLELVRTLFAASPPPASGLLPESGDTVDLIERAVTNLPVSVLDVLLEAGVTRRKIPVPSDVDDAAAKKAWMKAMTKAPPVGAAPAPSLEDFLLLVDEDLTADVLISAIGGEPPSLAGLRIGMPRSEVPDVASAPWQVEGEGVERVGTGAGESRRHEIVIGHDDGKVAHIRHKLLHSSGKALWPLEQLTALFGKPKKKTKQLASWLVGGVRISMLSDPQDGDAGYSDLLELELIDESVKDRQLRHHKLGGI